MNYHLVLFFHPVRVFWYAYCGLQRTRASIACPRRDFSFHYLLSATVSCTYSFNFFLNSRQICASGRLARQLRARELVARSWAVIVLPRFAFPRRTHQFHVIRGVMTRARAYFFIVIFIICYCSRHHPATIFVYPSG